MERSREIIKLINYGRYASREVFISKTMIHSMQRENGMTHIIMEGGCSDTAKETPEEILAMPYIEEANKVIDWEQRRYEIAKHVLPRVFAFGEPKYSAIYAVSYADALIKELKKGSEK